MSRPRPLPRPMRLRAAAVPLWPARCGANARQDDCGAARVWPSRYGAPALAADCGALAGAAAKAERAEPEPTARCSTPPRLAARSHEARRPAARRPIRRTWSGPQYPPRAGACREAPRSHHLPRSTPPARVSSAPVPPAPPQSREQPAASAPPSTRSASRASWRRCRRAALRRAAPSTERPATRQGRNGHARQARWT